MNRTLAAAALAAVMLPAAAFQAAAAPSPLTLLGNTYTLQCQINANDGAALKIRIMVRNTSGHVIKQGTPITVRYIYRYGPGGRFQHSSTKTQIAYRDVMVKDSIGFDQPRRITSCTATVTLRLDTKAVIKKTR